MSVTSAHLCPSHVLDGARKFSGENKLPEKKVYVIRGGGAAGPVLKPRRAHFTGMGGLAATFVVARTVCRHTSAPVPPVTTSVAVRLPLPTPSVETCMVGYGFSSVLVIFAAVELSVHSYLSFDSSV